MARGADFLKDLRLRLVEAQAAPPLSPEQQIRENENYKKCFSEEAWTGMIASMIDDLARGHGKPYYLADMKWTKGWTESESWLYYDVLMTYMTLETGVSRDERSREEGFSPQWNDVDYPDDDPEPYDQDGDGHEQHVNEGRFVSTSDPVDKFAVAFWQHYEGAEFAKLMEMVQFQLSPIGMREHAFLKIFMALHADYARYERHYRAWNGSFGHNPVKHAIMNAWQIDDVPMYLKLQAEGAMAPENLHESRNGRWSWLTSVPKARMIRR